MTVRESTFQATERYAVSALTLRPRGATALYVLGHGAGAGMRHGFMESLAVALAARKVATFRYQFPYAENGRRAPDRRPVLLETILSALGAARETARGLPLFAGGKSMGGRMTSLAAAEHADAFADVRGLIYVGFPLHAPGKGGSERAAHLASVAVPQLFLQGTRDKLANLDLITDVAEGLKRRGTLHVVEHADHGFHVPKKSGRTDTEVLQELVDTAVGWIAARA